MSTGARVVLRSRRLREVRLIQLRNGAAGAGGEEEELEVQ